LQVKIQKQISSNINFIQIFINKKTFYHNKIRHFLSTYLIFSGGVGRTGTMIAIYNIIKSFSVIKIWNNLSDTAIRPFMSVFNTVRKLREQRYGMVSSKEQYKYIYEFCIEWYKRNFTNSPNNHF
jgi:protein tyrosine phosphatase